MPLVFFTAVLGVAALLGSPAALAQTAEVASEPAIDAATPANDGILLNFPSNAPLKSLIVYVSDRLKINVICDEALVNRRVTLQTPAPLPESALLPLLDAVLRTQNLALEQTDMPGTWLVTPTDPSGRTQGRPGLRAGIVTRMFVLQNMQAGPLVAVLQPLLSNSGAMINALPEQQAVIVSDKAGNMDRIAQIIALVDVARDKPVIQSVEVHHISADAMVQMLTPLLLGMRVGREPQTWRTQTLVTADVATNRIVVLGMPDDVAAVLRLIRELDQPGPVQSRVYRPKVVNPVRFGELVQTIFANNGAGADQLRVVADPDLGLVAIAAAPPLQERIAALLAQMDVAPTVQSEPVRFYKLTNTVAKDVLATLGALSRQDELALTNVSVDQNEVARATEAGGDPTTGLPQTDGDPFGPTAAKTGEDRKSSGGGAAKEPSAQRQALVAQDPNTNSIIVIGSEIQQRFYAEIIRQLDQRRPQVLIETTIVTLDTSNNYSLGIDIGRSGGVDDGRVFSFSAFGLSDVNRNTGRLALPAQGPLTGGNFALLSADIADVVIRALASNSRARLVSMPRILVNDNEKGSLRSVNKEPFQRTIVTDSSTIVGEGNNAEAGTTITVTPHISEGDYLQLEYAVELSTFTGQRQANLPPPSQTNEVESRVTIPDGNTIIVGGLNRSDARQSVDSVPILGDIPLLKHLFRSENRDAVNTTLFVFIRPTILRDDQFRDLKHLSTDDRAAAGMADDAPTSEPLLLDAEGRAIEPGTPPRDASGKIEVSQPITP